MRGRGLAGLQDAEPLAASNPGSGKEGCKTGSLHRGGRVALAAFSRSCSSVAAVPRWALGPLRPPTLRSGPGAARKVLRGLWPLSSERGRGACLNLVSFFPLFCRLASGVMAQRAFPNPYADFNKSLAEGYFDSAGRVSFGIHLPAFLPPAPSVEKGTSFA